MSGKLYIVGTPIGNLEDMSPRAVRVLSQVDFIAAEDTRVTRKLLTHFEIKNELTAYYEHNKGDKGDYIINRLLAGESCAVVTDAGMPAISDPGEDLVRAAHENGITVESVPGPVAVCTALSLSGMKSGRFCFEGFLSVDKSSRKRHLEQIKDEPRTMIFYEAPHKLNATLADFCRVFGENRPVAVVKELTKIHETVFRATLGEAAEYYIQNPPRGEYVLIVDGKPQQDERKYTADEAVKIAKKLMGNGLSASAAAKEAAEVTGIKKGEIYREMIKD